MLDETNVDSFVLRFVREAPGMETGNGGPAWRGMIRHVQSNRERGFMHWADALAFIGEFVDLTPGADQACEELPHE